MISPEEVGLSSERLARIRPAVGKHIGDDKIAGAVTLVARRGKVVHLMCWSDGSREQQTNAARHDLSYLLYDQANHLRGVDDAL